VVVVTLVGFSGSRSLPVSFSGQVAELVDSVTSSGRGVAVGCASGLDLFVRSASPGAMVFRASSMQPAALVSRSVAMVRAVVGSGQGCGLIVFPGCACPAGLGPSRSSSRCFCGLGSGSWATAAFAVGLGVPAVVFGVSAEDLPVSWGAWSPAGSGVWASGFRLVPPAQPVQQSLF
jgi:hypothetical protein